MTHSLSELGVGGEQESQNYDSQKIKHRHAQGGMQVSQGVHIRDQGRRAWHDICGSCQGLWRQGFKRTFYAHWHHAGLEVLITGGMAALMACAHSPSCSLGQRRYGDPALASARMGLDTQMFVHSLLVRILYSLAAAMACPIITWGMLLGQRAGNPLVAAGQGFSSGGQLLVVVASALIVLFFLGWSGLSLRAHMRTLAPLIPRLLLTMLVISPMLEQIWTDRLHLVPESSTMRLMDLNPCLGPVPP
ncbi:hypothetical protein PAPYR_11781 [Paratrimastix pyriformis]|uniref:Uncharacterized protein n=1 Tax=Paratrimastix pyriformis TaxID=342808 RepID=A0ABQ8U8L4_9EUKA|nr:hypothetical protein PAPYR_11781 [Paratrimastix pyriformis]